MAIARWIKAIIDGVGTVSTVIGGLGLSAWIAGAAAAIGGAAWAMIIGLAAPLVIMAAFCTLTGAVYLALAPMAYRTLQMVQKSPARTRPDPEIWRHLPNLQLFEAACLLADIEPDFLTADNPGDANGWFRALCEAINAKEILWVKSAEDNRHTFPDGYHPHRETIITRNDLQKFAEKRQIRRAFLSNR